MSIPVGKGQRARIRLGYYLRAALRLLGRTGIVADEGRRRE